MGFVLAEDVRDRYAFWIATTATFGALALIAKTEGIGYTLREVLVGGDRIVTPTYSAILWVPATMGADGWGPFAWLNTLYWVSVAGLVGKGLARLDRRLRASRRVPARRDPRLPAAAPDRGRSARPSGHPTPARAAGDAPPSPPPEGSGP